MEKNKKRFSNTAVGRAMQRQYDKENGIAMQKVIPEIEVFPNYYDLDKNGYGNSFAIDKEHRPRVFARNGETTTPYIPLRLDEQNWLNRVLGINNFTSELVNFIFNPANVVPTIKTMQGIEALSSMSRGTTPVVIESERIIPKVATVTKSTRITPNNTLSAYELRDYMSNAGFRDAYNTFAKKYGYKEMPKGLSREEMNKMAKDVIERHNTFYRGVTYQGAAPEDIESVTQALGHKPSEEEFLQYVATHPRPNENAIFVSPSPTIASMYGKPARIVRPYILGNNRMNWFAEGDYTIGATGSSAEVINPWIGKYSSSQELANPTELLIPKGRFNGWFE